MLPQEWCWYLYKSVYVIYVDIWHQQQIVEQIYMGQSWSILDHDYLVIYVKLYLVIALSNLLKTTFICLELSYNCVPIGNAVG